MTKIDLKAFCSDPKRRPNLGAPFSAGEFTYASNGHVCVRVDRQADCAEAAADDKKPGVIGRWFARLPNVVLSPFPEVAMPPVAPHVPKPCTDCNATGRVHSVVCDKSHGAGLVTCHACNQEDDCKSCDGYGNIDRPATTEDSTEHVKDCEACDGTGDCSPEDDRLIFTRVGPYWIDRRYVVLMQSLPGVKIDLGHTAYYDGGRGWNEPPILFSFDGGVGAIMPLSGPVPANQQAHHAQAAE